LAAGLVGCRLQRSCSRAPCLFALLLSPLHFAQLCRSLPFRLRSAARRSRAELARRRAEQSLV